MSSDPVKQPNSHNCFVCGLRSRAGLRLSFYETGPDEVTATWTPSADYEGFPGVLHGGIVAAVLDEAGARVMLIGDHNHFMMTARMDVKYRLPTPIQQPVTVVGRLVRRRGRLAVASAELRLPDGSVTAEAELTLADLPTEFAVPSDLEALGWKVYAGEQAPAGEAGHA